MRMVICFIQFCFLGCCLFEFVCSCVFGFVFLAYSFCQPFQGVFMGLGYFFSCFYSGSWVGYTYLFSLF